uniref:Plastid-encoded RNA polymerase subunit alpha n=1 Tax=Codium arabicum TaxID=221038 RepID=A0A386B0M0_CODAR|nr:RNA polymerase a-subunit [Codium arabicum]AYC65203.1 RNA polymerase a-subunit [Codium arabicum]
MLSLFFFMKSTKFLFSCVETQILKNTNSLAHFSASFQLGFFSTNQGLTIANALRRTLLLQKLHYSISGVFIQNVQHEYSCLKGLKETILDLLINLEKIIFSSSKLNTKTQFIFLCIKGPKIIKAKDLPLPSFLFCINPDQYIATLDIHATLNMTLLINNFENNSCSEITTKFYTKLYGQFIQPKQFQIKNTQFLFLNTQISPILNINYTIKKNLFNQEIILLHILTNGSVHPSYVLHTAIKNLILSLIPYYKINQSLPNFKWTKKKNTLLLKKQLFKKVLCIDLANFNLSIQTYQTLQMFHIYTLGDLYKLSFKQSKFFKDSYNLEYKELQTFLRKFKYYLQQF